MTNERLNAGNRTCSACWAITLARENAWNKPLAWKTLCRVRALARAARYVSEFVARDLDATRRSPQPGPRPAARRGRPAAGPSSVPEGVRPVRGRGTADRRDETDGATVVRAETRFHTAGVDRRSAGS